MSKFFKKFLLLIALAFLGIGLVGCGEDVTITTTPSAQTNKNKNVAKLDASLQGTYYGDDVVVVISESKVSITDPSGKTLEFTIYKEGDRYYIEEEGQKVYCTFGDGTVTNIHGTFYKNGGGQSGTDTPAQIDATLQGDYFAGSLKITVGASKVTVIDVTGQKMEYNLYQENGRIYFYDEGQKIYCTFENDTIKNDYGIFTRNSGGMTSISAEEAAVKFAGFLEFNGQFRVPSGSAIADMKSSEDGVETYVITVASPSEDYNTYKAFFDDFFSDE